MSAQSRGKRPPTRQPKRPASSSKTTTKRPSAGKPAPAHNRRQAAHRRSTGTNPVWWIVTAVVVVVGIALVIGVAGSSGGGGTKLPFGRSPAPAAVVHDVTTVPQSVIDAVGGGGATLPKPIAGKQATGKPDILYIGAEFCPYCAAQRWAIVNALSRFGTFSNLSITHSSSSDVLANTPTFSFYGSKYESPYFTFSPVETTTNEPDGNGYYKTLETPTAEQDATWQREDASGRSFPFVDIDGRFAVISPQYDAGVLQGKTQAEVAAALSNPDSPITKGIVGAANSLTAAICKVTNNQPATVCGTPTIQHLQSQLTSS
jgi:hypothetical protein